MVRIPDEELIQQLQFGEGQEVDKVLTYLHKRVYALACRFIEKHKGTVHDAEDIFQESLVALYKLARNGKLTPDTNVEAYLFTICKNLWFKHLRRQHETVELTAEFQSLPDLDSLPLYSLLSSERQTGILQMLSAIGEDCKRVLLAYYYDRLRMSKIAAQMGYANEQVAKNKKADCMKKLKKLISDSPYFSEK